MNKAVLVAIWSLAGLACHDGERAAEPRASPAGAASRETGYSTGDPALDALQREFLPTLEANRREFAGQTGLVRGFGAGPIHPPGRLRDSAAPSPAPRHPLS